MHICSVYTLASILLRLKLSHIHRLFHPSVNMQKIDLCLFKLFFFSSFLYDVTMKSVDGKEFPCHKCVLCARLGR